jgi:hypothetical protein
MALAGSVGPAWILARRNRYRRVGVPIDGSDAVVLSRYFDLALLARARVARVDRIDEPWVFKLMSAIGRPPPVVFGGVSGLAVDDTIGVVRGASMATVFHELVHVAQYRRLGLCRFAREYVRGWIEGGYEYVDIPLEAQAYALQARFEVGEVFSVEQGLSELGLGGAAAT